MEQEPEYFDLPEPTPSGVCGWCHIEISKEYGYYRIYGNMCDKCSARVSRSIKGESRENIDADLTKEFNIIHTHGMCVKTGCDKNVL
jgi:hypothetical protein